MWVSEATLFLGEPSHLPTEQVFFYILPYFSGKHLCIFVWLPGLDSSIHWLVWSLFPVTNVIQKDYNKHVTVYFKSVLHTQKKTLEYLQPIRNQ